MKWTSLKNKLNFVNVKIFNSWELLTIWNDNWSLQGKNLFILIENNWRQFLTQSILYQLLRDPHCQRAKKLIMWKKWYWSIGTRWRRIWRTLEHCHMKKLKTWYQVNWGNWEIMWKNCKNSFERDWVMVQSALKARNK